MKFLIRHTILICLSFVLFSATAQESQNDVLQHFDSGKYTVYKVNTKNKFEKVKKPWPVEISKNGNNISSVLVKRSGILDELFKPDVPGYPAYFAYKTFRLSFRKDYAVYYEWNGKQQAKTKYVLVKPKGSFDSDWETVNKNIAAYATATFKNQTGARAHAKEVKVELAAAERKMNSLEGKQVANIQIELVETPQKIAHFSPAIHYGILATLKDGTTLKTKNLGGKMPWEDFKLSHEGCSNTSDVVRVDEDASNIPNDQVVLRVTSVFHPSLKAVKKLNTTYDVSIQVNQNGFWGHERHKHVTVFQGIDGQHAGRADNLIIKVKAIPHKQTGKKINKIEVFNTTKNKLVARYKLAPDTKLIINAIGGQGMNGYDGRSGRPNGGNGGNGGAGGNITIIKDPSVTKINIETNTAGGRGGKGGTPKYTTASYGRNGASGDNGNTTTQTKSVLLKF